MACRLSIEFPKDVARIAFASVRADSIFADPFSVGSAALPVSANRALVFIHARSRALGHQVVEAFLARPVARARQIHALHSVFWLALLRLLQRAFVNVCDERSRKWE